MVGIGLTAGQACGAVLLGSTFAALLGFMSGQCGRIHHLGYGNLILTLDLLANILLDS
jgi:NCS1 family nucleobase:cation symporter-1